MLQSLCALPLMYLYLRWIYSLACFLITWQGMITVKPVGQETSLNSRAIPRLLKVSSNGGNNHWYLWWPVILKNADCIAIERCEVHVVCSFHSYLLFSLRRWQEVPSNYTRHRRHAWKYDLCWKHRHPDCQWAAGFQQVSPLSAHVLFTFCNLDRDT